MFMKVISISYRIINLHFFFITFNLKPAVGLSVVSGLISSNSSSLGERQVIDSLLMSDSILDLGILGEGKGVAKGVGRGVGKGVGISLIGDRHLFIVLGTSRSIDGG